MIILQPLLLLLASLLVRLEAIVDLDRYVHRVGEHALHLGLLHRDQLHILVDLVGEVVDRACIGCCILHGVLRQVEGVEELGGGRLQQAASQLLGPGGDQRGRLHPVLQHGAELGSGEADRVHQLEGGRLGVVYLWRVLYRKAVKDLFVQLTLQAVGPLQGERQVQHLWLLDAADSGRCFVLLAEGAADALAEVLLVGAIDVA